MQALGQQLDALVFDYGNTLIEFGHEQVTACDRALSTALGELFGAHDFERLTQLQHHERRAPYVGEFREHDLRDITRKLVRKVFDVEATESQLDDLLEVRFQAMTAAVQVEEQVHELLERLATRFRLALISNYPCSRSINHSLRQHGFDRWLEVVVVSADVGHVKPHPRLFESVTEQLGLKPEAMLFIGDNWLGDIQGAKRFGMKAAWTTQYVPYELFEKQPGDHDPDLVIRHISELRGLVE